MNTKPDRPNSPEFATVNSAVFVLHLKPERAQCFWSKTVKSIGHRNPRFKL